MRTPRWLAGLCLLAATQTHAQPVKEIAPFAKASFYFAAHQDDWQLFMNPSAFDDVVGKNTKAVFIHTTAGDAGLGMGWGGRKHPFYLARDNGAELAIRFMADAGKAPAVKIAGMQTINGHPIYRIVYRNTVSYFLRVPDGHWTGTGYYDTGFQSLQRLAQGQIDMLTAIDGTASYHGWNDLVATVRAIIDLERERAPAVQINVAETDARINPADHSDHLMTAKAALDAVASLGCAKRVYYVDYASRSLPENLNESQRARERTVYAVTADGVRELDQDINWSWYDKTYVGRNYFRAEEGSGRCDLVPPGVSLARHAAPR
jgi:hypothetical protein